MTEVYRCAAQSLARSEPLHGTASTVRAFLLIEVPGAWGVDAIRGSRLPDTVKDHLLRRVSRAGVRPLLVRRHGRSRPDGLRVFAGYVDQRRSWLATTVLPDPLDLLGLDHQALARGATPEGMTPHDEPLFLVCTHGRHDVCCAEQGRPVAATLTASHPAQTWEVSHIGGDRFAGNLLVLPEGLYYGRVTAATAGSIAAGHLAGDLSLDHLRGRCCYPFAVQAADSFLRRKLGEHRFAALPLASAGTTDGVTSATFGAGDAYWRVDVRVNHAEAVRLTCQAVRPGSAPTYTLLGIERVR